VGLSTAKGLCHALEIPIIGVPSLKALASQLPYTDIPIAPILDSRKGELFVAKFVWNSDRDLVRNMKDSSLNLESFPPLFQEPTIFIGNDFPTQGLLIRRMLGHRALLAPPHCWSLRPSAVGFLGLKRFHDQDFDDPQSLNPLYLRPPDIRPKPFPVRCNSG
jgi:tRNA threonylcarbamoyladenosine biosynthesis protein TsaB